MARSGIYVTHDSISRSLAAAPVALDRALGHIMKKNEPQVQAYAQRNAVWTDRTGNARQGLKARAGKDDEGHFIDVFHTMPYGIWLEVRWSGKYAIIKPTIRIEGRRVLAEVRALMGMMKRFG